MKVGDAQQNHCTWIWWEIRRLLGVDDVAQVGIQHSQGEMTSLYMDVSKNRGTPKSSILMSFSM